MRSPPSFIPVYSSFFSTRNVWVATQNVAISTCLEKVTSTRCHTSRARSRLYITAFWGSNRHCDTGRRMQRCGMYIGYRYGIPRCNPCRAGAFRPRVGYETRKGHGCWIRETRSRRRAARLTAFTNVEKTLHKYKYNYQYIYKYAHMYSGTQAFEHKPTLNVDRETDITSSTYRQSCEVVAKFGYTCVHVAISIHQQAAGDKVDRR